jgi:hypothetical protein
MEILAKPIRPIFFVLAALFIPQSVSAQEVPPPPPEIELLKKDVGEWEVDIKVWSAPGADPAVSKGKETTRMFGDYWTITNFEGKMMGMDFQGHGTYGYDVKKGKYIGTWIDSLGPYMMHTEGDYDKQTETLTVVGDSPGPDGVTIFTYTMSTCYKDGRVMTMYMQPKGSGDDQKMKFFEMTYKKAETKAAGK